MRSYYFLHVFVKKMHLACDYFGEALAVEPPQFGCHHEARCAGISNISAQNE